MDMLIVQGGRRLSGVTTASGAKNAALPIMAAVLACDGPLVLDRVPNLADVGTLRRVLDALGATSTWTDDSQLTLEAVNNRPHVAEYELVRRMRASVCVLGPLLARRGRACVSLPGGCAIGHRPIDLHLKGLRALGATISIEKGYVFAQADRLHGAEIYLGGSCGSTVTGTCNVMTAATLAEGVTTISAAACEPEVVDLGRCLNAMGARISGLGTPVLRIEGVSQLKGTRHAVISDRIEGATLLLAAAVTRGRVRVENSCSQHLAAVVDVLRSMGVIVTAGTDWIEADATRVDRLRPVDCTALPYPGVPTDVQAQITAALTLASGISVMTDKVFPDRFLHVPELARLGAEIRREGASAILAGVSRLSGACVMASDLRASAALLLAALAADGASVVRRIYHLDRGYERLDAKLVGLGAHIERVVDCPENLPAALRVSEFTEAASDTMDGAFEPLESFVEPSGDTSNQELSPPQSDRAIPQPKFLRNTQSTPAE